MLGYQLAARVGVIASLSGILGGRIEHTDKTTMGGGVAGSLTGTLLALPETLNRPFVLASLTFGHARSSAISDDGKSHDWIASDLRAGLMVGKTFASNIVPFAVARAFAGPVQWRLADREVTGGDLHHYAVGLGATYRIPGAIDAFVELLPLGEQSVSAGASFPF